MLPGEGGGIVAGARRVMAAVWPVGALVLQLAGPTQSPRIGICVLGWVESGALVVSPSLVPVGRVVLPPVASGL